MTYVEAISKLESNSEEIFEEVTRLLIKIANNILDEPFNLKIRTLNKSNATISKRVLSVDGGCQCLKIMGFQEFDTHFVLPLDVALDDVELLRDEILKRRDNRMKMGPDEVKNVNFPNTLGAGNSQGAVPKTLVSSVTSIMFNKVFRFPKS